MRICVRVCVCVGARVRACARACVCVFLIERNSLSRSRGVFPAELKVANAIPFCLMIAYVSTIMTLFLCYTSCQRSFKKVMYNRLISFLEIKQMSLKINFDLEEMFTLYGSCCSHR